MNTVSAYLAPNSVSPSDYMSRPEPQMPKAPVEDADPAQRIAASFFTGAGKLQTAMFEAMAASAARINGRFDSRVSPTAYEMALRRTMGDVGKEYR